MTQSENPYDASHVAAAEPKKVGKVALILMSLFSAGVVLYSFFGISKTLRDADRVVEQHEQEVRRANEALRKAKEEALRDAKRASEEALQGAREKTEEAIRRAESRAAN